MQDTAELGVGSSAAGADLGGCKAAVIVTEIFDSELLGEGVLPTMRHAVRELLQARAAQGSQGLGSGLLPLADCFALTQQCWLTSTKLQMN